ncbi:MAG: hypothetical protein PF447_13945 [Spirochaetaceae bacterium]|jgi:hypothetical protein|nr:hypothetical protein [Spirochaetaceae bacterium]
MKKSFALIVMFILLMASCYTGPSPFSAVPFTVEVDGHPISSPVDLELLQDCIKLSLIHYNWRIYEKTSNSISAEYVKDGGTTIARIEIPYGQSGYSIRYLESQNLDVDLNNMTIHTNYNRWIANLNKAIFEKYTLNK